MKNRIISILLILNLITTIGMFKFFLKEQISKEKEIIKEMTEVEYDSEINNLNVSHTAYSNYINETKINLATAITNAGIETDSNADFETMIENVSNIITNKTGDATATANGILTGQTAYVNGEKITGTMSNNGTVTEIIDAGGSYTIPEGYHDGNGKVTASGLTGQTSGTATADQILKDQTAWVNGTQVTGTMANRGALNWNPSSSTSYTVPEGYYSGGTISTSNAYQAGYNNGGTKGSLEGWSWSVASGTSFTAPYNCYAIAFSYAGTHNASGDQCSSSTSISSTGTNVYVPIPSHTNTSTSSSSAFVGPLSRAAGIYKLSKGQTITMSCSGYQGGSGVIMYAPI